MKTAVGPLLAGGTNGVADASDDPCSVRVASYRRPTTTTPVTTTTASSVDRRVLPRNMLHCFPIAPVEFQSHRVCAELAARCCSPPPTHLGAQLRIVQ